MALSQVQTDILSLLKKAEHVLIMPSSPIDGDSLGSSLSLYLTLQKMGKKSTVVAEQQIPLAYNFLPEIATISPKLDFAREFIVTIDCRELPPKSVRHEVQGNKINIFVTPEKGSISKENVTFSAGGAQYDCIVTVDAADPSQFGKIYDDFPELFHLMPVINIDHHASNTSFGKLNFVDIMAASTTMMIYGLIQELGVAIDADIATLLLAGIITDTGSFQNPNTTPEAFSVAAKLIGLGARQQEIIRHVYKTKKLSTLRLWGRTLTKIQYDEKHKMVWSVLTAKDFAEIGSGPDETEGVIDELMSNAPGAEVIFLLKEKSPTEAGGSIRTLSSTIDASVLAGFFGGGGHTQASGFKMQGKGIVEVEAMVVAALRDYQKKRLRIFDEKENDATEGVKNVIPAQAGISRSPVVAGDDRQKPVPPPPTQTVVPPPQPPQPPPPAPATVVAPTPSSATVSATASTPSSSPAAPVPASPADAPAPLIAQTVKAPFPEQPGMTK